MQGEYNVFCGIHVGPKRVPLYADQFFSLKYTNFYGQFYRFCPGPSEC